MYIHLLTCFANSTLIMSDGFFVLFLVCVVISCCRLLLMIRLSEGLARLIQHADLVLCLRCCNLVEAVSVGIARCTYVY